MSSQSSDSLRSVSFEERDRVYVLSPSPSPEPDLGERMPLQTNGVRQAGVYGIPVVLSYPPQYFVPAPQRVQPTLPLFPVPPTPLLPTVELPPSPSPGPALPLRPTGTISSQSVPTLGSGELALLQSLPIVWRLEQQWDVRDWGLPVHLPANEPVPALCGVPEVVLRFVPALSGFPAFSYTIAVEPNFEAEGRFVVTIGELARAVQAALRVPLDSVLEGRLSEEQRSVLDAAQRYRRFGRRGTGPSGNYCRVDMWGPGRMFLRHLMSLSSGSAEEESPVRREFAVQFQLIAY